MPSRHMICVRCGERRPATDFARHRNDRGGRVWTRVCEPCLTALVLAAPEEVRARARDLYEGGAPMAEVSHALVAWGDGPVGRMRDWALLELTQGWGWSDVARGNAQTEARRQRAKERGELEPVAERGAPRFERQTWLQQRRAEPLTVRCYRCGTRYEVTMGETTSADGPRPCPGPVVDPDRPELGRRGGCGATVLDGQRRAAA